MKEVYILRHGEKDKAGNLTGRGKEFAKQLGGILPKFTLVIASDIPRTIETATLLTGKEPTTDDRARYYNTTPEVSSAIGKLAEEQSLTFLEAASIYNGGELADGIRSQAAQLNTLVDDTLTHLNDGERALVVSHDMAMTPAMALRGQQPSSISYLSGFIVAENGMPVPFEAYDAVMKRENRYVD